MPKSIVAAVFRYAQRNRVRFQHRLLWRDVFHLFAKDDDDPLEEAGRELAIELAAPPGR